MSMPRRLWVDNVGRVYCSIHILVFAHMRSTRERRIGVSCVMRGGEDSLYLSFSCLLVLLYSETSVDIVRDDGGRYYKLCAPFFLSFPFCAAMTVTKCVMFWILI